MEASKMKPRKRRAPKRLGARVLKNCGGGDWTGLAFQALDE